MTLKNYKTKDNVLLYDSLKKRYFGKASFFSQFYSAQILITRQINKRIANDYKISYKALDQFVISYLFTLKNSSNEFTLKELKDISVLSVRTIARNNNQLLNADLVFKYGRRGHYRMTPKATVMICQYGKQYTKLYEELESKFPGIIFKI
ncbi:MAG: hypothetical protein KAT68_19560 [Bacteroidales bacterium]|nr:hypothetical protein [Bacteroidales bacterium]